MRLATGIGTLFIITPPTAVVNSPIAQAEPAEQGGVFSQRLPDARQQQLDLTLAVMCVMMDSLTS